MLREPTAGSGKPRRGHKNIARQPGSRPQKKQAREEPSRDHPQGPRGSGSAPRLPSWGCAGTAGCPAASATPGGAWLRRRGPTSCGQHVCLRAHVVVLEGHERAHQSELGSEQQNRFRNSREIQRIDKKAFRARADAAQSARQGGTEPGPPASETDAGPPGHQPRSGAPARPRLSRGQEGPT